MKKSVRLGFLAFLCFFLGAFIGPVIQEKITPDDVRSAAKIIGLEFTQQEIDSLLPGLEELQKQYEANREIALKNAISPALVFNPLPAGFTPEKEQKKLAFSKTGSVKLPANRDDLAFYTVRQLAELIRTRQISSLELTQFFIDRLKKYDPSLHCVVTLTEELAIAQAKRADEEIKKGRYKGFLHGIPYGAKDLLATKRYKTTWGAMPYKDQMLDYDATVIQKLEAAGAVLVAKMTLGALARGDVWFGERTRNPWDTSSGSSGSSAGSASAVAAGLLPFAIGTETMGSIVSPSTVCGVTGLRPTFGRVSRHGAMALAWSMDKIGPICRTVEDCAIVFNAIYGPDEKDPSTIQAPFNYNANLNPRNLRVGYLKSAFESDYPTKIQDSLSLEVLRSLGFQLIPIELPPLPNLRMITLVESAAAFEELTLSGRDDLLVRQDRGAWPNSFRQSRFIPAVEYIQANRLRSQLIEQMHRLFQQVDVYINPTSRNNSLQITNYTGHPCVVLPNGFRNGKPASITFTGKLFGEAETLLVAKAYQDATDWHKKHPDLQ